MGSPGLVADRGTAPFGFVCILLTFWIWIDSSGGLQSPEAESLSRLHVYLTRPTSSPTNRRVLPPSLPLSLPLRPRQDHSSAASRCAVLPEGHVLVLIAIAVAPRGAAEL